MDAITVHNGPLYEYLPILKQHALNTRRGADDDDGSVHSQIGRIDGGHHRQVDISQRTGGQSFVVIVINPEIYVSELGGKK